jgi:hypothetical protein
MNSVKTYFQDLTDEAVVSVYMTQLRLYYVKQLNYWCDSVI